LQLRSRWRRGRRPCNRRLARRRWYGRRVAAGKDPDAGDPQPQNRNRPNHSPYQNTSMARCAKLPPLAQLPDPFDVAIVGAGAAGLSTAIFARRLNPTRSVALLEGARTPGAKILVSGGSRCNLTNSVVTERDFWGGRSTIVRRVLRAFPVDETIGFFRELGVEVHEEAGGKLFPNSNRAREVLDALLREKDRLGIPLLPARRVTDVSLSHAAENGAVFQLTTTAGPLRARSVVLATGGQSLPKSGSDGTGFVIARHLGHTIVPPTPALVPLLLDDGGEDVPLHTALAGVSQEVELTLWIDGSAAIRLGGPLLWTHIGASGPVAMNASRHWLRAGLEGRTVAVTVNFVPGVSFEDLDRRWTSQSAARPTTTLHNAVATVVPASVAAALIGRLGLDGSRHLAQLSRNDRRQLVHALVAWQLPVTGTRGYNYAEVTAGGVSLPEIDPTTMQSRICPRLYLAGEILDVDGRIGGFNFQWAWSSGKVAGGALAKLRLKA
jgi:predicted Rossmann fold flavoprotein